MFRPLAHARASRNNAVAVEILKVPLVSPPGVGGGLLQRVAFGVTDIHGGVIAKIEKGIAAAREAKSGTLHRLRGLAQRRRQPCDLRVCGGPLSTSAMTARASSRDSDWPWVAMQ